MQRTRDLIKRLRDTMILVSSPVYGNATFEYKPDVCQEAAEELEMMAEEAMILNKCLESFCAEIRMEQNTQVVENLLKESIADYFIENNSMSEVGLTTRYKEDKDAFIETTLGRILKQITGEQK